MTKKYIRVYLLCCLLAFTIQSIGQEDFGVIYKNSDPAPKDLHYAERISIHQEFLDRSSMDNDSLNIILAHFYLANDYVIASSFDQAMAHLIKVEELVTKKYKTLILGRASHKKGAVYSLVENNISAITEYEKALELNTAAKDSQFMAFTLEQLGAMYGYEEQYEKSKSYYERAIPMIKQYCEPKSLATTLSNYGNTLLQQNEYGAAVEVYKQALEISTQIGDKYRAMPAQQNLALAYLNLDSLNLALALYRQCKETNQQEAWLDLLAHSYKGLAIVHEELEHTDSSLYYYKKFHTLNDSLYGVKSQTKINTLVSQSEAHKQQQEIDKKTNQIVDGKHRLKRVFWGSGLLTGLCIIVICYIIVKKRKADQQLKESHAALLKLSKVLQVKNAEIRDEKLVQLEDESEYQLLDDIDILNTRILTDDDWSSFKALFAKAYPSYLQKIRAHFDSISEAEERLFLFIKLNLTSRESADILGIKPETIKKTRSRLRKRLSLDRDTNLDDFIKSF